MATTTYDAFLSDILPYVRNCPDPTIEAAVRSTTIEMCEKTEIWQADLDPISTIANQWEYDLEPPAGSLVHRMLTVTDENGNPLEPVTSALMEQRDPDWRDNPSKPRYFIKRDQALIWFTPPPAVAVRNAILIRAVLKPTISSVSCDSWIMTDFRDTIVNGAIARLTQMPDRDWSNFKTSAVMYAKFLDQLVDVEKRARQANEGVVPIVSYGGIGAKSGPRRRYDHSRRSRLI